MNAIYDAGYLVAIDRGDRIAWAKHQLRLARRELPVTTAPVIAQVSRSARQASLHRLLRGCHVEPFATAEAHAVGALLAASGTADVVDAHLALVASRLPASTIITSDARDMRRLATRVDGDVQVRVVGI